MNIYIPSQVITKISGYTLSLNLPQKSIAKLNLVLTTLWLYIKISHENYKAIHEIKYNNTAIAAGELETHFVNISSVVLKKFTFYTSGTNLQSAKLLKILSQLELIQINQSYSTAKFSKSFRPHLDLLYDELMLAPVDAKKLIGVFKTKNDWIKKYPHYKKLIEDLYKAKIDISGYAKWLRENPNSIKKNPYYYLLKAFKINLGIHFFVVTDTGRVYTAIANLSKHAIPFLTLGGKPVVEIDAVNSQPLLLAGLVDNNKFKEDVQAGVFYEKVQDCLLEEGLDYDRTRTKQEIYKWVLFNEKRIGDTWQKRLDKIWEGLSGEINTLKLDKQLWRELQEREANVWITQALKIKNPVLTKHDSLLLLERDLEKTKKSIEKTYNESYSLKISLK